MSIGVGDRIPAVRVKHKTGNTIEDVDTAELFAGKTVVLFGLPGAFTPTCSGKHVPGYLAHAADFKAKGVDLIVCLSVNDAHVMEAWGRDQKVGAQIMMLADGDCAFTQALGLDMDMSAAGLGTRSRRFALVAEDGVVTHVAVEPERTLDVSAAEKILQAL